MLFAVSDALLLLWIYRVAGETVRIVVFNCSIDLLNFSTAPRAHWGEYSDNARPATWDQPGSIHQHILQA